MPWWRRSSNANDRAGVHLEGGRISLVAIRRDGLEIKLHGHASVPLPKSGLDASTLDDLARQVGVRGLATTLVLDESDYQLQMIEAPRVESSELRSAVRWKVKDLIDFHIDDAVFDAFAIPSKTDGPQGRDMMYTVTARTARIGQLVRAFHRSAFELSAIDIPELALRNLARLDEADARGRVTLYIGARSGLIVLSRQGELFMSRRLGGSARALSSGESGANEDLLLEIQRSMDFYTSHFGQARPAALGVVADRESSHRLADWLDGQLDLDVQAVEASAIMQLPDSEEAPSQSTEMIAMGGALRREGYRL